MNWIKKLNEGCEPSGYVINYPTFKILDYPKNLSIFEQATRCCYRSEDKMGAGSDLRLLDMIMKKNHTAMTEFVGDMVVRLYTNRGVTHEAVRMRLCSFCLSGDTKILRYNQQRGHLTIKELYDRHQSSKLKCKNDSMLLRSMNADGILVPNSFKQIIYSGKKEVYEVKTSLGYTIKTSKNHIFFTPSGEKKLRNINEGDFVFVNGVSPVRDFSWLKDKLDSGLSVLDIAKKSGCSYSTVRKYIREFKLSRPVGYKPKSYVPWNTGLNEDDPRVKKTLDALRENQFRNGYGEKNTNWKSGGLKTGGLRSRFTKYDKIICEGCGRTDKLENHHRDGDIKNWEESNRIVLCQKCHKVYHLGYNVKHVLKDEVISIKCVGVEDCYDIEMSPPFHNFVANGFVVHNSQSSTRYIKYDQVEFVLPYWASAKGLYENPSQTDNMLLLSSCIGCAEIYKQRIDSGQKPQMARGSLNNDVGAFLFMKTNMREWVHILGLRCDNAAHPDFRLLACGVLITLVGYNQDLKRMISDKVMDNIKWFNDTYDLISIPDHEGGEEVMVVPLADL